MKRKVLKFFLPLVCIILFVAASVWYQARQNGNNAGSPEDALQAALEGDLNPAEPNPDPILSEVIPDNIVIGEIPEKYQELTSEIGNAGADTGEFFSEKDLPLCDLYAFPGQTVRFHVYHSGALDYEWEWYDVASRRWISPATECTGEEADALGRMTAYADFVTPADQPELMIRCLYELEETGGQVSEIAFLTALPQEIRELALSNTVTAEAGDYLASCDIAVEVTYMDGSTDIIDGIYGLYFMESEVEEESSEIISVNGMLTERKVQTVRNHFRPFHLVTAGEENIVLAYIPDVESPRLQLSGIISGTDAEPPEISTVDILSREYLPGGEDISMTILVTAEDNVTPYPGLQYAIIQKESADTEEIDIGEIAEEDWFSGPRVTVSLQGDSMWFLCCRDQAGNVSVYGSPPGPEKPAEEPEELPDTQAPVIRNIYVEADE